MIHYHGTPVGGTRQESVRFLTGRHALIPFPRQDDLGVVAEVCQSFVFDNGAFSIWKKGGTLDVESYVKWVSDWCKHPGFQWALIPDVIDGNETDNDALILDWELSGLALYGVPVWHLHESLDRLLSLAERWPTVALGSSGEYRHPGSRQWWERMRDVMRKICDEEGRPITRLHGLRMLSTKIFPYLPFASADSTNASMNSGALDRYGSYIPPTRAQRAEVIAERIEAHNSANRWDWKLDLGR